MKARKTLTPILSRPMGEGESSSAGLHSGRLRLRITAAAESIVRGGHPWVFARSVREQNREGQAGELAVIYDRKDKFLGVGLYDPDSPIRVRLLHVGKPETIDAAWWVARLEVALRRRAGLFDEQTTGYRLINGESDGWPGLVLDRYDSTLVLKIYTTAWLGRLEGIISLIRERLKLERVVIRYSRNVQGQLTTANRHLHTAGEESPRGDAVQFLESGLRFEADVWRGQKTGFFLDQRENRRLVESLAHGRTVLNAFSFSGGFSLYAARGGAKSVTDLDISLHALESGKRNFRLNQDDKNVKPCRHETIQADAFKWLAQPRKQRFDLIVLDPPSLAKRETERAGAIRAYGMLAAQGIRCLKRTGVLVACSCSAHVSAEEFFDVVRQSTAKSGRKFVELHTTRHAPDHPATFKEAEYLKAVYLRCDSHP